jgi:hypothetical protein
VRLFDIGMPVLTFVGTGIFLCTIDSDSANNVK